MSCGMYIEACVVFDSVKSAKKDWPKIADIALASDIQLMHLVHPEYQMHSSYMAVSYATAEVTVEKWKKLVRNIIKQHNVLIELVVTLDDEVTREWFGRARRIRNFLRDQKTRVVALYNQRIDETASGDDTAVLSVKEEDLL